MRIFRMFKLILSVALIPFLPVRAIVWRADLAEAPSVAKGEMKQVGKVYFSPLRVFGASCVALGGEWVLTCRHGTEQWSKVGMSLHFPALGQGEEGKKKSYEVKKVIFPKKGDFALLKLAEKVQGASDLRIFAGEIEQGQRAWIGGFGLAGPVGKVKGGGGFHAGHNRIDGMRAGKISISLSKPGDESAEKDEATLARFDSGSPIFVKAQNAWLLVGVASSASHGGNPGYGDRGNYADLRQIRKWIKETTVSE